MGTEQRGVFTGVRVVEIACGLAGAVAARWLAELGADVVRVEPPGGDELRRTQPAAHASWNRSKAAVVLDLADATDLRRLHELLDGADVLVHGFTPSRSAELGLADAPLASQHPSLVVASVPAYPVNHPDAERHGDELLVQARVGMMDEQEALRDGPMFIRLPVASWSAAFLLGGGVAARLLERARTGAARPIHTSLFQGALAPAALYWQRAGNPPAWFSEHTLPKLNEPPHITIFQCADGRWLEVMGGFTKAEPFREILAELGESDLFEARPGLDNRDRWAKVFATRTSDAWMDLLWAVDALCMPILEVGEILGTEQARANDFVVEVDDPVFGATVQAGAPFHVNGPPQVRHAAPAAPSSDLPAWPTAARRAPVGAGASAGGGPLAGVRVVDFGSYVAGPYGSQCLADFGADVIKVEPIGGEKAREINQFTGSNRGKRGIVLDLKHPRRTEVIGPLVASADVVMHNVRLAAARKMGIDEASIRAINPKVVFAHAAGYGNAGPWAPLPAFDPTGFALSGWGHGISGPGNRPSWLRMSTMDCSTGMANFVAITAALYGREVHATPGSITTSLLAVGVGLTSETLLHGPDRAAAPIEQVDPDQTGYDAWRRIYRTSDHWVAISCRDQRDRDAAASVLGGDPSAFEAVAAGRGAAELLDALVRAGVPAERVMLDHRDALFDAELALPNGLVRRIEGTPYGWFEAPSGFWGDGTNLLRSDRPIPAIGQHTTEVLQELGMSASTIDELLAERVVAQSTGPSGG